MLVLLATLYACSSQQVYDASQGLRQSQCERVMDMGQREACLQEAGKPFRKYEKERSILRESQ